MNYVTLKLLCECAFATQFQFFLTENVPRFGVGNDVRLQLLFLAIALLPRLLILGRYLVGAVFSFQ